MISDYFITIRDIKSLLLNIRHVSIFTILGELVIVAAASIMFFVLNWPLEPIIFTIFALALLYWRIEGRLSIGLGLVCLVLIVIMQLLAELLITLPLQMWSEQMAVWAYYFLAIGVIKQILELALEKWSSKSHE